MTTSETWIMTPNLRLIINKKHTQVTWPRLATPLKLSQKNKHEGWVRRLQCWFSSNRPFSVIKNRAAHIWILQSAGAVWKQRTVISAVINSLRRHQRECIVVFEEQHQRRRKSLANDSSAAALRYLRAAGPHFPSWVGLHGDNSRAGSPPSKHTPASLGQEGWKEHHSYCLLRSKWCRGGTWVESKEKKGAVCLCNCKLVSTQRKSIQPSLPAVLLCCCRVGWSASRGQKQLRLVGGASFFVQAARQKQCGWNHM